MRCFIIGTADDKVSIALETLMRELGLTASMSANLSALRADRGFFEASQSLVLVPDRIVDPIDVGEAIDFASDQSDSAFVVCLADTIAPGDYKRLVRTGCAEWIAWRDHREELRELVTRHASTRATERAACVLSFLPSKGGVGNTTLAIEVAIHLSTRKKRRGTRIAILDLNLQGGTVADSLDIEPRFDVAEIVDRPERLDEQLVDIFTSRHSKGLDIFASPPGRIGPEKIKPEIIFAFIDSIAHRYDAILFDLPAQSLSWTDNLLRGSDAVIVCGGESVPALRRLNIVLGTLDGLSIPEVKIAVVLNAVDMDLLGRVSRRAVIERAMGRRQTFLVRRDVQSAIHALDVGRPISETAPNSGISRDLKRLSAWVEVIADRQVKSTAKPVPARGAAA